MRYLFFIVCILLSVNLFSQDVVSGEYFFDVDPQIGKGKAFDFVASTSVSKTLDIPTKDLTPGFHNLFVRVKNSKAVWGHSEGRLFYILSTPTTVVTKIVSAEWFIDKDPGIGKGTSFVVSPDQTSSLLDVTTKTLTEGFHNLFVRVKNSAGVWSHYEGRLFYVLPTSTTTSTKIVSAEWFIDQDPGIGKGTSFVVTSDQPTSLLDVSTQKITAGFHNLFVRVKNSSGVWSHYKGRLFYVMPALIKQDTKIVSGEWFVDKDPGIGKGKLIPFTATNTLSEVLDLASAGVQDGAHNLFIRVVNDKGVWSHYEGRKFLVCKDPMQQPILEVNAQLCAGDTLHLTGKPVVGATSYYWKGPNSFTKAGLKAEKFNVDTLQSGTYTLFAVRAGGTACDTTSASISVLVKPLPKVSFSLMNPICDTLKSIVLTGGVPIGGTYVGKQVINSTFNTLNKAGSYTIEYTFQAKNGCNSQATSTIKVLNCTQSSSVDEGTISGIHIFPNPTSDFLHISTLDPSLLHGTIHVSDVLGRSLVHLRVESVSTTISLRKLGGSGVYLVYVYDSKGVFVQCTQVVLQD